MAGKTLNHSGAPSPSERKPIPKYRFWSRWKESRKPGQVIDLLRLAMAPSYANPAEKFDEAVSIFKELTPEQREKPLGMVRSRLEDLSLVPFESDYKVHEIHVLADFIIKTSKCLPRNAEGDITDAYYGMAKSLESIVNASDPDGNHRNHNPVRVACVYALNELGYGYYNFWEARVLDPTTQDAAIRCMLEMPPQENPGEHGWHLLKVTSQEAFVLADKITSHEKMCADLEQEAFVLAEEIKSLEKACANKDHDQKKKTKKKPKKKHKNKAKKKDKKKTEASSGKAAKETDSGTDKESEALQLKIAEYRRLLRERQQLEAQIEDLAERKETFDVLGIAIALNPSPMKIDFLSSLIEEDTATSVMQALRLAAYLEEGRAHFDSIAEGMLLDEQKRDFWPAAREFRRIANFLNQLEQGKNRQSAVIGLLGLWSGGSDHLLTMLGKVCSDMEETAMGGEPEAQLDAIAALGELSRAGIASDAIDVQSIVDNLLDKNDERSTSVLRGNVLNIGLAIANSSSRNRIPFIARMLYDQDPETVTNGFRVAMHVEGRPDVFTEAAVGIICADAKAYLHGTAQEYLNVIDLKDQLGMAGDVQFNAASDLIGRFQAGATYLYPILREVSEEMTDVYTNPAGGNDDEMKAEQQKAVTVIAQLALVGINTPGFDVRIGADQDAPEVSDAVQDASPQLVEQVGKILGGLQQGPATEPETEAPEPDTEMADVIELSKRRGGN